MLLEKNKKYSVNGHVTYAIGDGTFGVYVVYKGLLNRVWFIGAEKSYQNLYKEGDFVKVYFESLNQVFDLERESSVILIVSDTGKGRDFKKSGIIYKIELIS